MVLRDVLCSAIPKVAANQDGPQKNTADTRTNYLPEIPGSIRLDVVSLR